MFSFFEVLEHGRTRLLKRRLTPPTPAISTQKAWEEKNEGQIPLLFPINISRCTQFKSPPPHLNLACQVKTALSLESTEISQKIRCNCITRKSTLRNVMRP